MNGRRRLINSGLLFALAFLSVFILGCIEKIDRPARLDFNRFFPLTEGDWRSYSGPVGKSVITRKTNNIYTFTYYDSLGNITGWKDFEKGETGTYLKNIVSKTDYLPSVYFEPALRFSPWINVVGDTLYQTATEISLDSLNSHASIAIKYLVEAIDTVSTPAGTFAGCIKISMSYSDPAAMGKKVFDGTSYWWFAYDVGLVQYEAFGSSGVLISAKVDGQVFPSE